MFDVSFSPAKVADDPRADAHFAFAIPLQPDRAARLDRVRLSTPGRVATSLQRRAGGSDAVRSVRVRPGIVALQWDASAQTMAMVRDPGSGQVLGFVRGGRAEIATTRSDLEVQLSGAVGSLTMRVGVQAR